MKNSVKRTTAAILAAMMIGTGMYAPTADHYNLFSETSITAEAASVGKVTGLKSNTLSNSEIKLKWSKVKGASGKSGGGRAERTPLTFRFLYKKRI